MNEIKPVIGALKINSDGFNGHVEARNKCGRIFKMLRSIDSEYQNVRVEVLAKRNAIEK